MGRVMLVIDDPGNCVKCPGISGYGRKCLAADKPFDKKDYHGFHNAYPGAYKPEWCPLVAWEEDAQPTQTNESNTLGVLDCISRQAAIDALKAAYWDKNIQSAKDDPCVVDAMTDWAIRQVKALPSAQPEIIRCKDCKWFGDIGCAISIVDDSDKPTENDFCSFAERKE